MQTRYKSPDDDPLRPIEEDEFDHIAELYGTIRSWFSDPHNLSIVIVIIVIGFIAQYAMWD